MVKSGQSIVVMFTTANPSSGAAENASVGPTGTLYVNGVANAAAVTVTNVATGVYKASVTLPTLAAGDVVSLRIAATVDEAGEGVVFQDIADTCYASEVADLVWDEAISGHTTTTQFGGYLQQKLSSATVSVSNPVATGGDVTTYRGDDYYSTDGRALEWSSASWPTLTGATITVVVSGVGTYTGAVVSASECKLELSSAQTSAIAEGDYSFQVYATLADGHVVTLVDATWTSRNRLTV